MMNKYYKPMLPTLVESIPVGSDWIYEAKYDGFRCLLYISEERIELISRNLINISSSFPEILNEIKEKQDIFEKYIPLVLDGEIVILESQLRADFEKIQVRGRTKIEKKINILANEIPAQYITFDILMVNGLPLMKEPLLKRKEHLSILFSDLNNTEQLQKSKLLKIQYFNNTEDLWSIIVAEYGEGIVAKRGNSTWDEGTRTKNWLKIKNWKKANFIILSYEKQNGYFHVGLLKEREVFHAGLFLHGINEEERTALYQIIKANAAKEDSKFIFIKPSICVELLFLDWYKDEIRQPRFSQFRLDVKWEACTWEEARKRTMKSS